MALNTSGNSCSRHRCHENDDSFLCLCPPSCSLRCFSFSSITRVMNGKLRKFIFLCLLVLQLVILWRCRRRLYKGLSYPLKAVLKLSFCNFFNILWFKTGFIKIWRKGFKLFFFCEIIDALYHTMCTKSATKSKKNIFYIENEQDVIHYPAHLN